MTTRRVPAWLHDMAMRGMVNVGRPSGWTERDRRRPNRIARVNGSGHWAPGSRRAPGTASDPGRHRAEGI